MKIRVLILRLLTSWWLIPAVWTLVFLIAYLTSGYKEAVKECKELTYFYWNGES